MSLLHVVLVAALAASTAEAEAKTRCIRHQDRVGPCRTVHGRVFFANGAPSERIWVVGTKRILGVTGRMEESLPPYLRQQLTWDRNLYGDYLVCPLFDPPQDGRMEFVCVHTWRNLVLEDISGDRPVVRRVGSGPAPEWPLSPE
jgi:hypothetical protein